MEVVSHINRQGGSRPHTLNRHARRLLLWTQTEAQVRGMYVELSNSSPDLGFVQQSVN